MVVNFWCYCCCFALFTGQLNWGRWLIYVNFGANVWCITLVVFNSHLHKLSHIIGRYRKIPSTFWYIILVPLCGIKLPIFYVYWDNLYRLTALLLGLRVYCLGRTSWSHLDCLQLDIVCECCYFQWLWMTSDLSKPKHRAVSPTPELLVEV